MKHTSGVPCLPKRFCCFFKLKWGVYGICFYLITIGILQIISLFGAWDLGVNNILLVGDIACMIFAILSLIGIKKLKVGTPLKILGVLWGILVILNIVSHLQAATEDFTDQLKITKPRNETTSTFNQDPNFLLNHAIFTNSDGTEADSKETVASTQTNSTSTSTDYFKQYEDLKKQLDQESLQVIFGAWNIFKIYCSLCVFKLGLKIQNKHGRNFYYKLY